MKEESTGRRRSGSCSTKNHPLQLIKQNVWLKMDTLTKSISLLSDIASSVCRCVKSMKSSKESPSFKKKICSNKSKSE